MKLLLKNMFFCLLLFPFSMGLKAQTTLSIQQQAAIKYLDSVGNIQQSIYWPNVKPALFIKNLRRNITQPLFVYAGTNTNFCGYAALSYTCISTYPLRYVKFMFELYKNGKADFRNVHFNPSPAVKRAVGTLRFKGELDINPADQLWFMSLADHFKGYLNLINLNYKPGDENMIWPATNYAKFNRMLRKICNYEVEAVGSDLIKPYVDDIPFFLRQKLNENHQVIVYLNNAILHRKNHEKIKYRFPTHYVVLMDITAKEGMINLTYWDYGFKTLLQISPGTLRDIIYGITWCKKKSEE